MDEGYVSEQDCSLCSTMWASERPKFRKNIRGIPLDKPVCNACLMAFARNIGFPVRDDPVEH
jgi:hypothetical protein